MRRVLIAVVLALALAACVPQRVPPRGTREPALGSVASAAAYEACKEAAEVELGTVPLWPATAGRVQPVEWGTEVEVTITAEGWSDQTLVTCFIRDGEASGVEIVPL